MSEARSVTVALGGGGAKGSTHLGVLMVLEREGFQIEALAGSSVGAMIAAFYAAGHPLPELVHYMERVDQSTLFTRSPGDGPAFLGLTGVHKMLNELIGNKTFADLARPLVVTVVNLRSGQIRLIREGSVIEALLASMAVPGIFPSVFFEGQEHIDGSVLYPVPVRAARLLRPELPVVAVALSPSLFEYRNTPNPPSLFASLPLVKNVADRLVWAKSLQTFMRGVDLGGLAVTDGRLLLDAPEVLLRPQVHEVGLTDRVDVMKLVMAGEVAMYEMLPDLRRCIQRPAWQKVLEHRLARWIARRWPALQAEIMRLTDEP